MGQTYFQKGFNLKAAVRPVLAQSYHSAVVDRLKELDYRGRAGDLTLDLIRFGPVVRAVKSVWPQIRPSRNGQHRKPAVPPAVPVAIEGNGVVTHNGTPSDNGEPSSNGNGASSHNVTAGDPKPLEQQRG